MMQTTATAHPKEEGNPSQEYLTWSCDGHELRIGMARSGTGPTIMLLPALSSMSTRREMYPLQERLSGSFATVTIDWPGFGEGAKPFVAWRPEVYERFLDFLLAQVVPNAHAIIAAGHAAGYVIKHFAARPDASGRLVLLSPTWRGPLPTMMGGNRPVFPKIARMFDYPVSGTALYRLNVNRMTVALMARGHVYSNPRWLQGQRMREKMVVTRAPGARHGSARFVTGALDPFGTSAEYTHATAAIRIPILNVFAETAPPKSRREMEAIAALSNVSTVRLPQGKLCVHEEFPDDVAAAVEAFLTP